MRFCTVLHILNYFFAQCTDITAAGACTNNACDFEKFFEAYLNQNDSTMGVRLIKELTLDMDCVSGNLQDNNLFQFRITITCLDGSEVTDQVS